MGKPAVKDKRVQAKRVAGELSRMAELAQRAMAGEDVDGEFRPGAERAGWQLFKALLFASVMEEGGFGELVREFLDQLSDPRDSLRRDVPHSAWQQAFPAINGLRHGRRQYLERVREQQEDEERRRQLEEAQRAAVVGVSAGPGVVGAGAAVGVPTLTESEGR